MLGYGACQRVAAGVHRVVGERGALPRLDADEVRSGATGGARGEECGEKEEGETERTRERENGRSAHGNLDFFGEERFDLGTDEFFGSGAVEAVVDEADFTGTIDEVAGRHRGDADCFHELLLPVVEGGEGRREFLREGGGGGGFFVDADGEEDKTARGEIGVDFCEGGKGGFARPAPRGPEINEHDLAGGRRHGVTGNRDNSRRSERGKRIPYLDIGAGKRGEREGVRD